MPLIVTGSEGQAIYGTGSIVSENKQGEQKTEITGSVVVSGSMLVTGTLEVSGNTIHNYGNFYNIGTNYADGRVSGSGVGIFVKGVETAGDLNVSGNTVMSGNLNMYGNYVALALSSTVNNSHYSWGPTAHKSLLLYDYNSNYAIRVQNQKTYFGGAEVPTHTVHVGGDISGSGKIFNLGGIETQGSLGVTGSVTVRNNALVGGNIGSATATHPLTVIGDISGSAKIFNVGGIETQGDLGVTGSVTIRNALDVYNNATVTGTLGIGTHPTHAGASHPLTIWGDISGSGKIFNVGGIETATDLGVTGSVTIGNSLLVGKMMGGGPNIQFTGSTEFTGSVRLPHADGAVLAAIHAGGSATPGQIYYNITTNKLNFYNGSGWSVISVD